MSNKKTKYSANGALALFGSAIIYASFGVFLRYGSEMFGNVAQVGFRYLVATALLSTVVLVGRRSLRITVTQLWRVTGLAVSFATIVLLFTIAVTNISVASTVFLLYAGSMLSSILVGKLFFREHLTRVKVLALILSVLGLITYSGAFIGLSVGVLAAFGSGLLDSVANGFRKSLADVPRQTVLFYQMLISVVYMGVILAVTGGEVIRVFSLGVLLLTIISGLLMVLIGNLLLYGFQHFDLNIATVILSTELVFSLIFGLIFFGELPPAAQVAGGVLILIGSILAGVDSKVLVRVPLLNRLVSRSEPV